MKSWILLTIAMVFSLQAKAFTSFTDEPYMLTPTEFASLTHAEQKSYVRKMREIFVEMNENNPYVAAEMAKRSPLFAQLVGMTVNEAVAQSADKSTAIKEKQNLQLLEAYLGQAELFSNDIAKADISKMSDSEKKILEAKFEQSALYLKAAYSSTMPKYVEIANPKQMAEAVDKQITPMQEKIEANYQKIKAAIPNTETTKIWEESQRDIKEGKLGSPVYYFGKTVNYTDIEKTAKQPPKKEPKPAKEVVAAKKTQVKVNEPADPSGPVTLYRCMYAGFVIRSGKCVAPSELPWMIDGLNTVEENTGKSTSHKPKDFKCEDGKVMCNPFLFGAAVTCDWKKAVEKDRVDSACLSTSKPFCVKPNAYATRDCNSLAGKDNETSLDVAVYLMTKSEQNKKAFADFAESFQELCHNGRIDLSQTKSEAHAKADVKQTCDVAKKRFAEVRKKYDAYFPKKKASESKDTVKTNTKTKSEKGAK